MQLYTLVLSAPPLALCVSGEEPAALAMAAMQKIEVQTGIALSNVDLGGPPAPQVQQGGESVQGGGNSAPKSSQRKSSKAWVCPALAVGTAAGVAAATAIFMTPSLSLDMLGAELFSSGVDFSILEQVDCSAAGEYFEEGLESMGGEASELVLGCGACCGAAGEQIGETVEPIAETITETIAGAGETIAEVASNVSETVVKAGAAVAGAASAALEGAGE